MRRGSEKNKTCDYYEVLRRKREDRPCSRSSRGVAGTRVVNCVLQVSRGVAGASDKLVHIRSRNPFVVGLPKFPPLGAIECPPRACVPAAASGRDQEPTSSETV